MHLKQPFELRSLAKIVLNYHHKNKTRDANLNCRPFFAWSLLLDIQKTDKTAKLTITIAANEIFL